MITGWRQVCLALFATLIAPVALAAQVTVTVDWPRWAEENAVQIYDATNTTPLTPVFDDGPRGNGDLSFNGSQTYTLADNTSFTLRMTDSYGDGWNGSASVVITVDGTQVLNTTLANGFNGTAAFSTALPTTGPSICRGGLSLPSGGVQLDFADPGVTWTSGSYNQTFTNIDGSTASASIAFSNTTTLTSATESNTNSGNGDTAAFFMSSGFGAGSTTITFDIASNPSSFVDFCTYHVNLSGGGDQVTYRAVTNTGAILEPTFDPVATPTYTLSSDTADATGFTTPIDGLLGVRFEAPSGQQIVRVEMDWAEASGSVGGQHGLGLGQFAFDASVPPTPTPVSCPTGSAADGRATSGSGAFRDEIYWLDWSCGATTQFNPGDQVTKSWDAGNGVTLTAQLSGITAAIQPYNTGDWAGDVLDGLYSGINPIGLANVIAGDDPQFDITFSATLNGVPIDADIVVADAEDAATTNEAAVFTTDGTAFQPIEATGALDATFSNAGRTLQLDDIPSAGNGTMLALSEGVSAINLDLRGGGVSAAAFGVFLPFDHGDASGYGTSQAHYSAVSASGGSQPTSATAVTSLTLASVSYGSGLYLGSAGPDAEGGNQSSANADGDDTTGTNDEDGVTFPALTQGQAATISVDVTQASGNSGYLQGWIDWNGDGSFGAGEQVATDLQSATAGTSTISVPVTVPANATTNQTFARFRWSTTSGLDSTTAAPDGEVEDYALTVQAASEISGTVFEDANYGGGAGRDFATAGVGVPGATVELYDSAGALTDTTTTAADGTYSFAVPNGDYYVRVVNETVSSNRAGSDGSELGVQTYRAEETNGDAIVEPVTPEVGGREPSVADTGANAGGTLDTATFALDGGQAQSVSLVSVAGASVSGVDFGYNFSTIVNTNDTSQGSLRQFIVNTNLLSAAGLDQDLPLAIDSDYSTGNDVTVFMIPPGDVNGVGADSGAAVIAFASQPPDITANNVAIDGRTQTENIGNTNAAVVFSGATVGVDNLTVPAVNGPEIVIDLQDTTLDLVASGLAMRGVAVYGGGAQYAVRLNPGSDGGVFEENVFGAQADGSDPGSGQRNYRSVYLESVSVVRDNLFAFAEAYHLQVGDLPASIADGSLIEANAMLELMADPFWADSVSINDPNVTFRGNLISGMTDVNGSVNPLAGGRGIELANSNDEPDGAIVENNTITGTLTGGVVLAEGADSIVIRRNDINSTGGFAVGAAQTTGSAVSATVSQNRFYGNAGLGIDLRADGVTLNDSGDSDSGANDWLNFPQISGASVSGSTLTIQGCAPANATVELFESDISEGSAAAGDNSFGQSQDYGEGQTYIGAFTMPATGTACALPVDADGNNSTGMLAFNQLVAVPGTVAIGDKVTATATITGVGTSEFSSEVELSNLDYSDAPVSGTSYGEATHAIDAAIQLGAAIDSETASIANADASGDGADDDGVTFPTLVQGQANTISVDVTQAAANDGYLQGWVDWNGDGDYADAGEQVATDLQSATAGASTISVPVTVPGTATTNQTFARFRWSTTSGLDTTTAASDGEVEDYQVTISEPGNLPDASVTDSCPVPSVFVPNGGSVPWPTRPSVTLSATSTMGSLNASQLREFRNLNDELRTGVEVTRWQQNGGDIGLTLTFSPGLPADQIALLVYDLGLGVATPYNASFQFGVTGGATADDFRASGIAEHSNTLVYIPSTGQLIKSNPSHTVRESAVLVGQSTDLVTQITLASSNVAGGDFTGVSLFAVNQCDFSDAPASFGEPPHTVITDLFMGSQIDDENAALVSAVADGDDTDGTADEDGVTFPTLTQGQSATIEVSVTQASGNSGYLQGWIDWNGDGDFADTAEQVATDLQSATAGTSTISVPVTVPATATTSQTFARFRWSTTSGLATATAAPDGEVEDDALTILAPPLLDLNSAATFGDTDRNAALAYTEGDGVQTVMPSGDINAQGENDIVDLTIAIQDVFDGDDEIVTIGGESFPLGTDRSVNITFAGQDFTIDYNATSLDLRVTSNGGSVAMDEAALDALLQSITYEHIGGNPTGGDRDYDVQITDVDGLGAQATAAITVTPVDNPPVLELDGDDSSGATEADHDATFTEGDAPVSLADPADSSITDAEGDDLNSLYFEFEDHIASFADGADEVLILGGERFDPRVGRNVTITIAGVAYDVELEGGIGLEVYGVKTLAEMEAILATFQYENTSSDPTPGTRTLEATARDVNFGVSNIALTTVTVVAVNDPPVLDLDADDSSGATGDEHLLLYTEGDGVQPIIGADVVITDADDTEMASVGLFGVINGVQDGNDEVFIFGGQRFQIGEADRTETVTFGTTDFEVSIENGVEFAFNIVGLSAPIADVEAFLAAFAYENTSTNPTAGDRTLDIHVQDGDAYSNRATSTIRLTPVDTPPLIDLNSTAGPADTDRDFAVAFTEGGSAVAVTDTDAGVYDATEDDISTLRITLGGIAMTADEVITIAGQAFDPTVDAAVQVSVGGSSVDIEFSAADGEFALQGPGTGELPASVYDALVRSVTYQNTSANPAAGARTLSFDVSDDSGVTFSAAAVSTITVAAVDTPPLIDLNSAATSGDTDTGFTLAYTEGDGAQPLVDSDADINEFGEDDIYDFMVIFSGVADGNEEVITLGGVSFPLGTDADTVISFAGEDFRVGMNTGDTEITAIPAGPGSMDAAALDALLRSLSYTHTGANPTTAPRSFDILVNDASTDSNTATTTVTLTAVNNPPTLDFDADDSSGTTGADYATNFSAGNAILLMTDGDVAITDADDTAMASGFDVALSGFVDTGNEIVTIGGEAFTIGTGNVPTFTLGNTTFEIDSDGGDFGIVASAGTGEIADWEALFASMTYENTAALPTPGDRVLSFRVRDPAGAVSNVATSTVTVNATPTDLALSFDPPSGTPVIGFPYTVTLNLENESFIDATGVAVSFPLPASWTYVSDDTGGNYDPATGLWTVGQSNNGMTETVEFTLVPLASGPYDLTAEVSAANENDADSTPGNGEPSEDDQAGLTPAPQLGAGTAIPARSCSSGSVQTLDWDSETWAPGTRSAGFSYAGISVNVDITDPQGALDGTPNGPMPVAAPFYQGGLASLESTLIYETNDADLANGDVLTTISFGRAVDEVRLSLFDIDFSSLGPRLERVEIRGFNGASAVPVILDGGPVISINGAEAVGVDESDPTGAASGDGTVSIAFDQPVDRIEIDYGHAPGTERSGNPGHPGFALHDISFCGGTALLAGAKAFSLVEAGVPGSTYALPGEDVIYTLTVTNIGTGATDTDTVFLVDPLPPEVIFFNGDVDSGGPDTYPGNDPVGFVDNGSGLSFTYASDVGYSSAPNAPTDFSACSYTPAPGYDPAVTFICFNPKGAMAAGDPDPAFTVAFRAGIR